MDEGIQKREREIEGGFHKQHKKHITQEQMDEQK